MNNHLSNGGFDGNLDEWTGTGGINRSLGLPRLGCGELEAGETLSQSEGLSADTLYTLHYFYRLADGASLTAGYGSITQTHTGTPADAWQEGVLVFALDSGASDSVTFTASGATAYVDSVTLVAGGLPLTRQGILSVVSARIAALATDAGLSSTASGDLPEGDYTYAIDEALRQVGAVNRWGDPDVTALATAKANDVLEAAVTAMVQRLRSTYALKTDTSLGPRRESFSQIANSLDGMLSGSGADRRVKMGKLGHRHGWER
ncbi:MAG: hypothetical protein WBO46_14980 [Caldilineaceae bacterium]